MQDNHLNLPIASEIAIGGVDSPLAESGRQQGGDLVPAEGVLQQALSLGESGIRNNYLITSSCNCCG